MNLISSPPVSPFLIILVTYNFVPVITEIGITSPPSALTNETNIKFQKEEPIEEITTDEENISNFTVTENAAPTLETDISSTESELTTDTDPHYTDDSLTDSTSKYSRSVEVAEVKDEKSGVFSKFLLALGLKNTASEEEKQKALHRVKKEEREAKKQKEREKQIKFLSKGLTDVRLEDIISENRFKLCSELDENPKKDSMEEGEASTCKQYCLYRKIRLPGFIKGQNGVCKRELVETTVSNRLNISLKTDYVCYCEITKISQSRYIQIKNSIYFVLNEFQSSRFVTVHEFLNFLRTNLDIYKHKYIAHRQEKWDKKHRIRNIFRKESDENLYQLVTNYISERANDTRILIMTTLRG